MNAQAQKRVMVIPEEGIQGLDSIIQELPFKFASPLLQFLGRFVQEEKETEQSSESVDQKAPVEKKMPVPKNVK